MQEVADAIARRGGIPPEHIPLLKRKANDRGAGGEKGRADDLASELMNEVGLQ